ncbi:hypothetical protein BDB00DRAFT_913528 [Zychaea mexicana]|uniref:uncharacterized protein n=1 Tax=Zychaea mexicana TaxID=64656 RepID=UPI0022FE98F3|nr:uncharacterized protein BDB00DRAFT_913528 [Zychaea mexicana]KAI9491382.1 hypothetical protein BDB00DRAFT_913528 [Zychaea mexicana]
MTKAPKTKTTAVTSTIGKKGAAPYKQPLNPEFIKTVEQNFATGKPYIVCPNTQCKDFGTINMSADLNTAFDPPAPTFHCMQCRKKFTNSIMLEPLTVAALEAAATEMETEHEEHIDLPVPQQQQQQFDENNWAEHIERLATETAREDSDQYDHLHPNMPQYVMDIHKRIDKTNKVVAQLAEALAKNSKLIKENATLTQELQAARAEIAKLQQQHQPQQKEHAAITSSEDPAPQGSQASKYAPGTEKPSSPPASKTTPSYAKVAAKGVRAPKKRAVAAAARHLTEVPANQGYQFIYIPCRHRMTITNMRGLLRTLRIENSRVLDIHFPDHQTAALLVHNEYAGAIAARLLKLGVNIKDDFNPLDPNLLKDPKLAELTVEERTQKITEVHHGHILKALGFIRAPEEYDDVRGSTRSRQTTPEAEAAAIAALQSLGRGTDDDGDAPMGDSRSASPIIASKWQHNN